MSKRQFVSYWCDDFRDLRRYCAMPRDRVAHLLLAARSRGDTVHRIRHACGWNYLVGELAINQRHSYHDSALLLGG